MSARRHKRHARRNSFLAFILWGATGTKGRPSVATKLSSSSSTSGVFVSLCLTLSVLCLFAATHQSVAVPFRVVFPVVFTGLYINRE